MIFYYEPNLILKNPLGKWGKVVFQHFSKIEMTRNENRSFGRHFETVIFGVLFCFNMIVLVYKSTCTV